MALMALMALMTMMPLLVTVCEELQVGTVLGHKSERNPYRTLPQRLLDFYPVTVVSTMLGPR